MTSFETPLPNVKFISKEKEEFILTREEADDFAKLSTFVQESISSAGESEEEISIELPTPSNVLAKVLEFVRHYREEPMTTLTKPLTRPKTLIGNVQQWYIDFVDTSDPDEDQAFNKREFLHQVILAADFLNIETLMDLTCAAFACMVSGFTTPKQFQDFYRLPFELGEPDQETIVEANEWVEKLEQRAAAKAAGTPSPP